MIKLDHIVGLCSDGQERVVDNTHHVLSSLAFTTFRAKALTKKTNRLASEARQSCVQHEGYQAYDRLTVRPEHLKNNT